MEISNDIIEVITQNIADYRQTLEYDEEVSKDKKVEITDRLIELSNKRSNIRKSLGFDLYMLYFNLTEALIEENYGKAAFYRDEINRI